ncbi:glycosyltransferase family 4 protein [Achromobacter sp.]|uniref:glycosyltransferase family 4 protein n=1 Tax=Achromobacter sp. TaxID=134375 RepID=UPI003C726114
MRTLIVSQYFWPEGFRINEISSTLAERGMEIDVLTGKPNYPEGKIYSGYRMSGVQREQFHKVNITRVPLIPRGNGKVRLTLNYLSFIFSGLLFGPWLMRRKSYDVVFICALSPLLLALPGLLLAKIKRAPVVIWVLDLWPQSLSATGHVKNRYVLAVVERIVRFIYSRADLILVQSEAFVEPIRKLAPGKPIEYYPNSVDDSFSRTPTEAPPEVPGLDGEFVVMFAGNIGAAQAVEVIVAAAALLREQRGIQFVVLGGGSRREWMQQQVAALGLENLHLPGRFPVETMPAFMQRASALLVTLTDQEIFAATVPNKVQAYMASGKPILASLNGEGGRLVEKAQAGIAVPAEDAQALADAIRRLADMPEEARARMGENGRRYYEEHFNHERLVDQLAEVLETVSRANSKSA